MAEESTSLGRWRQVFSEPAMRYAWSIYLAMRVATSLLAVLILRPVDPLTTPDPALRPYQGVESSRLWARITSHERYEPRSLRRFVLVAIFLLTLPSILYILASLGVTAIQHPYPFYHERAEVEAVDWLAAYTSNDDNVFTTYWTGSYIAARAGNRVFLGHWAETMNYARKMEEAKTFFGQASDEWRKALLRDYNISYLFYGPRGRALSGFEPEGKPYLVESYSNRLVTIYRVVTKGG